MPKGSSNCLASAPAATRTVGLAGAGPLQHAADRAEVLDRAAQIAVARPGTRKLVHLLDLVVLVGHQQGDRAADRLAAPDAAEDFDVVGFEPLPAAAAISPLAAMQLGVDRLRAEFHAGGKAVDQGHQGFAVRFAGGVVAQHVCQFYPNLRGGDRPISTTLAETAARSTHSSVVSVLQETVFPANSMPFLSRCLQGADRPIQRFPRMPMLRHLPAGFVAFVPFADASIRHGGRFAGDWLPQHADGDGACAAAGGHVSFAEAQRRPAQVAQTLERPRLDARSKPCWPTPRCRGTR